MPQLIRGMGFLSSADDDGESTRFAWSKFPNVFAVASIPPRAQHVISPPEGDFT